MRGTIYSLLLMLAMSLLVGYSIGYITGGVTWKTYYALERAIRVLGYASAIIFVAGVFFRVLAKKVSLGLSLVLLLALILLMAVTGFHAGVGSIGETLGYLF
ncbi:MULTISPECIES: hypothetical protein [Pectobacterium]|uniref:hypothetical protein n=1 Tax=Pectobacterium TaxID=122277 RepID=UPI0005832827|nr:hypothetical protein [Pectobacterium brasiliense]KHS80485.1 hypothetical protein RC81_08095 [Pectobacterium brasiliense]